VIEPSLRAARLALVWDGLTSLKLAIGCLAALMVLVVGCTLAQVDLGTSGAVDATMRTWLVWWTVPRTDLTLPVFPGGILVGLVLVANLVAAQLRRLALSWQKSGIWIAHAGLILLVAGEFVSGLLQVDGRMAIEEGQTLSYVESARELELAVVDTTEPDADEVYGVPEARLSRLETVSLPGTPVSLRVLRFVKNADLAMRRASDPAPLATRGVGTSIALLELAPVSRDDEENRTAVVVEPLAGGRSYGVWLVSNALGAPQSFLHEGRSYLMKLRPRRRYLPYSLTLKKFSHDVYAGTDIPKNFSSLVHLSNPTTGEDRDVLIYMNQPLRYAGRTFYQASFGKNDTLSILQVVENPGWLLPYASCALVTLGLLVQFGLSLLQSQRGRRALVEASQ
jgi:hypothetical protein